MSGEKSLKIIVGSVHLQLIIKFYNNLLLLRNLNLLFIFSARVLLLFVFYLQRRVSYSAICILFKM